MYKSTQASSNDTVNDSDFSDVDFEEVK